LYRFILKIITQPDLIVICVKALKNISPELWISSFKKVNLHPDYRIPFLDWIKKNDEKVVAGEHFFHKHNNSFFQAMPSFWQHLTIEARHSVVSTIDRFFDEAPPGKSPWCKENLKELRKFCNLYHIVILRACYLLAKRDPSVFVGSINASSTTTLSQDEIGAREAFNAARAQSNNKTNHFRFTEALPVEMVSDYKQVRHDRGQQEKLFKHITNYVARSHQPNQLSQKDLLPTSHLDLIITR
jgi:hypothetical protein